MPNGKPSDHPINDLLIHNMHPFPCDMEAMIKKLNEIEPESFNRFDQEPFKWAKRKNLAQGRMKLRSLLVKHGYNPRAIALRAVFRHSLYLLVAIVLFGVGGLLWYLFYHNVPIYTDIFDSLNWIIPLCSTFSSIPFLVRWVRNR